MNSATYPRVRCIVLFAFTSLTPLGLAACGTPAGPPASTPAAQSQAETEPASLPSPSATETNQPLVFMATDTPSDCFTAEGDPTDCGGIDLRAVEVGLQNRVLNQPNDPWLPVVFRVTFSDRLEATQDSMLYLYLDVDQDPTSGFDMSEGMTTLQGIDRLVGVRLPRGETWTQNVASGGLNAEIVDDERVSARVDGEEVVIFVGRAILDERAPMAAIPGKLFAPNSVTGVEYARLAGGAPDSFTLFIGAARGLASLDYFNGPQPIQSPLGMTVPQQVLNPGTGEAVGS